jgi:hypothetical protein
MRKMTKTNPFLSRIAILATALCLVLSAVTLPAAAGEEDEMKPVFTRVALWDVERDHWGDFVEFIKTYNMPVMKQLFADGVISEYGIDAMSLHKPDGYTHATWFTTSSMADMDKVYDAWEQAGEALGEEKKKANDVKFNGMMVKHRDYLMRTEFQKARKALVEGGYYLGATFRVKMGSGKDFLSYYNNRIKPVYEKMLANGDIVAFGHSEEEIVTNKPGGHSVWYVVDNGAGLDKVREAFKADWGEMDEEGRRARWTSIMDFVEEGSFREHLSRIIHMEIAAQ